MTARCAYWLPEAEFHARPELLRTLEVKPPVIDGRVRVVEIAGFDTQACGGTHVRSTKDLGVLAVTKMEVGMNHPGRAFAL